jgi:hypothetical protein
MAAESVASQDWKTNPITLYCRNHATKDAGPTTLNGASIPSLNVSLTACCSWPEPETCDELELGRARAEAGGTEKRQDLASAERVERGERDGRRLWALSTHKRAIFSSGMPPKRRTAPQMPRPPAL